MYWEILTVAEHLTCATVSFISLGTTATEQAAKTC